LLEEPQLPLDLPDFPELFPLLLDEPLPDLLELLLLFPDLDEESLEESLLP
jgi:hypothetical protein